MKETILSIITVNFNNNRGLINTLESVKQQSFTSYEHIIIDANSSDGSKETIIQYAKETTHLTYWISEPDNGIYYGMNKGIEQAHGEYLYFLNSGDCLKEDVLSQIQFDGTQYIYCDITVILPDNYKLHIQYPDHIKHFFWSETPSAIKRVLYITLYSMATDTIQTILSYPTGYILFTALSSKTVAISIFQ